MKMKMQVQKTFVKSRSTVIIFTAFESNGTVADVDKILTGF